MAESFDVLKPPTPPDPKPGSFDVLTPPKPAAAKPDTVAMPAPGIEAEPFAAHLDQLSPTAQDPANVGPKFDVISPKVMASLDPAGVIKGGNFFDPAEFFRPLLGQVHGSGMAAEQPALAQRYADETVAGLNRIGQDPTILGKGIGALQVLSGTLNYTFSPFESFARAYFGEPARKAMLAATGSERAGELTKDFIGSSASIAAQIAIDPITLAAKGTEAVTGTRFSKSVQSVLSPTTVSPQAKLMDLVIRDYGGAYARANEIAAAALGQFQTQFRALPEHLQWEFVNNIELGQPQALASLDPIAAEFRTTLDAARDRVISLGIPGLLEHFNEHYFPHLWKNPSGLPEQRTLSDVAAAAMARSPIRGAQTFRKSRSIMTIEEGRQLGLEPLTDPMGMALLKVDELNKFYYGTLMMREIKDKASGLGSRFVRNRRMVPDGYAKLNDSAFEVRLPPAQVKWTAKHETAFDPRIRSGLNSIAKAFGFEIKTPLAHEDPKLKGSFGYTYMTPGADVVSRFGNELQVMEHEVGHQLDAHLGLWQKMAANTEAWEELGDLAKWRWLGQMTPEQVAALEKFKPMKYGDHRSQPWSGKLSEVEKYPAYLMNGHERIANFFHAYWYAPDLLRDVAPTALAHFESWLDNVGARQMVKTSGKSVKDLIKGVQPSLALTAQEREQVFEKVIPGWRDLGSWYAPDPVANVFNNYVSKGLGSKGWYDGMRQMSNGLIVSQLALSGFHVFFTSLDTMMSTAALGLEQVMRGEFGKGAANLAYASLPPAAGIGLMATGAGPFVGAAVGLGPGIAKSVASIMRGHKLIKGYRNPMLASPELAKELDHFTTGGGRISMDKMYAVAKGSSGSTVSGLRNFMGDLESGEFFTRVGKQFWNTPFAGKLALPLKIAGQTARIISAPIMEGIVPRQKAAVMQDFIRDFIERHPNATHQEIRMQMAKAWDSVDNRLGQMVYDNVFWHKMLKDILFVTVRSVGWNLGTVRELGGAVNDAARAVRAMRAGEDIDFTHKMAYAMVMAPVTMLFGGLATYLYTGHGPKEITDYFFPPTGKINDKGFPERVNIPSYVKDVLEYNRDPLQTLQNKVNPMWGAYLGLYTNRDFYGAEIRDRSGDIYNQTWDWLKYASEQAMPFSVRSAQKMSRSPDASWSSILGSFAGLQAAPGFITQPELEDWYQQRQDLIAKRRKARREAAP